MILLNTFSSFLRSVTVRERKSKSTQAILCYACKTQEPQDRRMRRCAELPRWEVPVRYDRRHPAREQQAWEQQNLHRAHSDAAPERAELCQTPSSYTIACAVHEPRKARSLGTEISDSIWALKGKATRIASVHNMDFINIKKLL